MLRKAIEKKDLKMELQIRQEINRISGLYINSIDVTSKGEEVKAFDISKIVSFTDTDEDTDLKAV